MLIGVLMGFKGSAQSDSVAYSRDFLLYEGLYLTYQDFRHNWPISKEKINTPINKEQLEFYTKLIDEPEINYVERNGQPDRIKPEKVWGYCQNNIIYINLGKSFHRISSFGAISYFVATVDVNRFMPNTGMYINSLPVSGSTNVKELRDFLMDFYTGIVYPSSTEQLLEMLKSDPVLYKEYEALSHKKKKEMALKYVRLYNEKHPVYFPKN
jgi:hypothetical protein